MMWFARQSRKLHIAERLHANQLYCCQTPIRSEHERLLESREGVKRNFTLLAAATSRLGGVPPLLDAEDCFGERGPDEKAVVLFTAYLCARLLEVSEEERAAHAIQRAWRARETRKPGRQSCFVSVCARGVRPKACTFP